ncbi:response regulator [Nocardia blacklockiae]|uniref:response regulator n=1 Tax=Nocardia blacklockiae TaxID=480036 RepID=UPI00189401B3|nr:response regulator [Nocardia blacklockiae]MBF6176523.1 hypothetical protein [Nocardia blacklockiae]
MAALLWPALFLVALLMFRGPVGRVIRSAERREFTLNVGGQEISMKQLSEQQDDMIADLQAQLSRLTKEMEGMRAGPAASYTWTPPPGAWSPPAGSFIPSAGSGSYAIPGGGSSGGQFDLAPNPYGYQQQGYQQPIDTAPWLTPSGVAGVPTDQDGSSPVEREVGAGAVDEPVREQSVGSSGSIGWSGPGSSETADSSGTADSPRTTESSGTTDSPRTTGSPGTAEPSGAADSSESAGSSEAADTSETTDTSRPTGPTYSRRRRKGKPAGPRGRSDTESDPQHDTESWWVEPPSPAEPPSGRPAGRPGGTPSWQPSPAAGTTLNERTAAAVLWVDDRPENNALIVDRLKRNGIRVDIVRTTDEALTLLDKRRAYGAIVSDWGRTEHNTRVSDAGLRLITAVRERGITTPLIIYSSALGPADIGRDFLLQSGATAATGSTTRLMGELTTLGLLPA